MEKIVSKEKRDLICALTTCTNGDTDCYDCENFRAAIDMLIAYQDIGTPEEFAAYKATGLTPEEIKELCTDDVAEIAHMFRKMIQSGEIDHLSDLLKAEQEGRLVVLPCKVGDTVYQKDNYGNIYEAVVQSVVIDKRRTIFITSGIGFDETAVGKTVFLTRAEAEAAMKGGWKE